MSKLREIWVFGSNIASVKAYLWAMWDLKFSSFLVSYVALGWARAQFNNTNKLLMSFNAFFYLRQLGWVFRKRELVGWNLNDCFTWVNRFLLPVLCSVYWSLSAMSHLISLHSNQLSIQLVRFCCLVFKTFKTRCVFSVSVGKTCEFL